MIFCEDCFVDQGIKNIINDPSDEDAKTIVGINKCPVCGGSSERFYNTETQTSLKNTFDTLLELYTIEDNLPKKFPKSSKIYLINDIKQRWNLFNPDLSDANIITILNETCEVFCEKNRDIFTKEVGIIKSIEKETLNEHSLVRTNSWDGFVESIKKENRFHTTSINEAVLKNYCSLLIKHYNKGQCFYRGRISKNKQGFLLKDMGAPPSELATPGRANAEGIIHLYLANDEKTTIHEIRAGAFDIVTIGQFILKKDIAVVNFQKLDKIYPFASEGITSLEYLINIEHLKKMNKEMSKTLRRNDSHLDYIPTQYIADYIKSFRDKKSQPLYRGIEYQSTMNNTGYNLVAFYPTDFKCISVKTVSVSDIQYLYG